MSVSVDVHLLSGKSASFEVEADAQSCQIWRLQQVRLEESRWVNLKP